MRNNILTLSLVTIVITLLGILALAYYQNDTISRLFHHASREVQAGERFEWVAPATTDNNPPRVEISSTNLETTSSSLSLLITSSEPITLKDNRFNLTTSAYKKVYPDGYDYFLTIHDIQHGENVVSPEFTDYSGNKTTEPIVITRLLIPVLDNTNTVYYTADGNSLTALVNKEYSLFSSYYPSDLVYLSDYDIQTVYEQMTVRDVVIDDLFAMNEEIEKLGMNISILSSYRSYDTQVTTYNYWVSQYGVDEADRASARPGHSEHQLGTTIDITTHTIENSLSSDFGTTDVGVWLAQNSWRYGFVLSYPLGSEAVTGYMWEPWHFRYVGKLHAKNIHDRDQVPDIYLREVNGVL